MTRIYQPVPLNISEEIRLDEKASHHLSRVLRVKVNDELVIFNGDGGEYQSVITKIDKKNVYVKLQQFINRNTESPLEIHLAQGIAKGEKMDFIIQKAVELGVTNIIPLMTERSNVKLNSERESKRMAHWQSIIISACEQCGRNRIPEICAPLNLLDWLTTNKTQYLFVLSPQVKDKLTSHQIKNISSIALLIGPEGGLSEKEIEQAKKFNALPLNLGPRILRTETATITALSVIEAYFGDILNSYF